MLEERIEAAKRPNLWLDRDIALAIHPGSAGVAGNGSRILVWEGRCRTQIIVPPYTASIDVAMTLLPKGWKLRQMDFSAPCADCRKWTLNLFGGKEGQDTFHAEAATPALALCSAALRSRNA